MLGFQGKKKRKSSFGPWRKTCGFRKTLPENSALRRGRLITASKSTALRIIAGVKINKNHCRLPASSFWLLHGRLNYAGYSKVQGSKIQRMK
jgi:hypothetical protein